MWVYFLCTEKSYRRRSAQHPVLSIQSFTNFVEIRLKLKALGIASAMLIKYRFIWVFQYFIIEHQSFTLIFSSSILILFSVSMLAPMGLVVGEVRLLQCKALGIRMSELTFQAWLLAISSNVTFVYNFSALNESMVNKPCEYIILSLATRDLCLKYIVTG